MQSKTDQGMKRDEVSVEDPSPKRHQPFSISRRTFVIGVGSLVALAGLGSLRYLGSEPLVRPPGGQDEENLTSKCIHCYRCVEACPFGLIVPASIETGVINARTPVMNFSANDPGDVDAMKLCDFCKENNDGEPLCVSVCPSTALELPADFDPDTYAIGVAKLDKDLCIAYRSSHCAFCYDACIEARGEDHAAIYYQDEQGADDFSTRLPLVDAEKCNGCGACESVCVSAQVGSAKNTQVRAIVVAPPEN